MGDNKLRCALVFRLEGGGAGRVGDAESGEGISLAQRGGAATPNLLAKYDHASEYDAHAGAAPGGLYGDREKNYADAVGLVVGGDPPGGVGEEGVLGGFKYVQSDLHQVVYGADADGLCELCFAARGAREAPSRGDRGRRRGGGGPDRCDLGDPGATSRRELPVTDCSYNDCGSSPPGRGNRAGFPMSNPSFSWSCPALRMAVATERSSRLAGAVKFRRTRETQRRFSNNEACRSVPPLAGTGRRTDAVEAAGSARVAGGWMASNQWLAQSVVVGVAGLARRTITIENKKTFEF